MIEWIANVIKRTISKSPERFLKYQCDYLYNKKVWSRENNFGWACQKTRGHLGNHVAATEVVDDE